jgi:SRSO17 transposase
VHHQYCGQLGKQANCQVAVTLSIANHHAGLPIAYRLYLPKDWADDAERRHKAHVPEAIRFKTSHRSRWRGFARPRRPTANLLPVSLRTVRTRPESVVPVSP